MTVIEARGAEGYLDGSIMKPGLTIQSPRIAPSKAPASMSTTPTPPVDPTPLETSGDSPNPSARKWKHRNAWTKMLLLFNTNKFLILSLLYYNPCSRLSYLFYIINYSFFIIIP